MTARRLGIVVLLCAAGAAFACGSVNSDDTDDGVGPADVEDAADVPEVADDASSEAEPEDGLGCEAGLTDCGGTCVDLSSDPEHCGRCDLACIEGEHATRVCASGVCSLRCEPGWVDVDGLPGCELECTPAVPAVESCNGADDDCDGLTDNGTGFECVLETVEGCATTCATTGERRCDASCRWTECVPPAETCDNLDQDCDGVADDGLYGVVWDEEAVNVVSGATTIDFSIGVAAEEVGVGYILATDGTETTTGQPRLAHRRLLDGSEPGPVGGLASGSFASSIDAGGSATALSVVWTTTDGATPGGESTFIRSALLGSSFSLGGLGRVDPSDEQASNTPAVVRDSTRDMAYVGWIENVAADSQLEVRSVEGQRTPVLRDALTLAVGVSPRDPSIALHADTTLLVVWSAGAVGEIRGQRLNTSLVVSGSELNLSNSPAVASEHPRAAASGAGFAVVWEEAGSGVMLALVEPSGGAVRAATLVASATATQPVVAPDLLGGFAVAYQTADGVELVRVNAAGVRQGEPLAFPGGTRPELASIPAGGLVLGYFHSGAVRLVRVGCGS